MDNLLRIIKINLNIFFIYLFYRMKVKRDYTNANANIKQSYHHS